MLCNSSQSKLPDLYEGRSNTATLAAHVTLVQNAAACSVQTTGPPPPRKISHDIIARSVHSMPITRLGEYTQEEAPVDT